MVRDVLLRRRVASCGTWVILLPFSAWVRELRISLRELSSGCTLSGWGYRVVGREWVDYSDLPKAFYLVVQISDFFGEEFR